jgi:hypothetical protein
MVTGSSPFPLFCGRLLLWGWLQATRQAKQPDELLYRPQSFCDRASLWVKLQAKRRSPLVMPPFQLSCACDVLPAEALLRATRPAWAIVLGQRKRWQVRLQKKELGIF